MKKPETFVEILHYTLTAKRVEPVARVKDIDHVPRGLRNRAPAARKVVHRYAIRGGISVHMLISENLSSYNTLLTRLKRKC